MAISYMNMQVIGRSSGRSAVAAAAYRSGNSLTDERTGQQFDYSRKEDIWYSEIIAPADAPAWMQDREQLWNGVEAAETRKDAQLAREWLVALPTELTPEQNRELLRGYVQAEFVDRGMVADMALHDMESHNPHGHVMLTMREIDGDGFGGKQRDWNNKPLVYHWREAWADHCNAALEDSGSAERIDHRSYQAQGIDKVSGVHLGPAAYGMRERGEASGQAEQQASTERQNRFIRAFSSDMSDNPLAQETQATTLYQQYREHHAGREQPEPSPELSGWRRHLERDTGSWRDHLQPSQRTPESGADLER